MALASGTHAAVAGCMFKHQAAKNRHVSTLERLLPALLVVAAVSGATAQDAPPSAPTDPELDQRALDYLRENGIDVELGTGNCVSKADDGSEIPGWNEEEKRWQQIPVGDGRWLSCLSFFTGAETKVLVRTTFSLGLWCWRGTLAWYNTSGDERLRVTSIGPAPDSQYYLITATTTEPGTILVQPGERSGGLTWPLFVHAHYDTAALEPAVEGLTCEQQFAD